MCYVQSACRQVYRNTVDLNVSLVHPYWPLKKCSCGLLCWALRTDTGLFSCTNLTGLVIFRILSACVVNLAWDEVYARSFLSMWNWRVLNVTRDEILCNKFSAHASPVLHIAASSVQHAINAWRRIRIKLSKHRYDRLKLPLWQIWNGFFVLRYNELTYSGWIFFHLSVY